MLISDGKREGLNVMQLTTMATRRTWEMIKPLNFNKIKATNLYTQTKSIYRHCNYGYPQIEPMQIILAKYAYITHYILTALTFCSGCAFIFWLVD